MAALCSVVAFQRLPDGIGSTIFNRNPSQSSGNWAGVGFSATGTMNSADIYICKSENKETLFVSGSLLYKSMPLLNDGIEVVPDNLHVR